MLNEIKEVIKIREYAAVFALIFATTFLIYFALLLNSATGIIDFKGYYIYFDILSSITISFLLSLVITINIYAYRIRAKTSKGFSLGSIIGAILPSSLCCTSIIPSIMALVGFSTPFIVGNTGKIQSVFAIYGPAFIAAGAFIAFLGLIQITKSISSGCKLDSNKCCEVKNEDKN